MANPSSPSPRSGEPITATEAVAAFESWAMDMADRPQPTPWEERYPKAVEFIASNPAFLQILMTFADHEVSEGLRETYLAGGLAALELVQRVDVVRGDLA